jgi:transposase
MATTTSAASDADSLILKADTRGRMLTPPDRRERLLDEFERSGLSGLKYAALVGIKYQTFASWVLRRRRERGLPKPAPKSRLGAEQVRWLEAVVKEAQPPSASAHNALVLQLPGGVRAELVAVQQVELAVALMRALDKPC